MTAHASTIAVAPSATLSREARPLPADDVAPE